METIYLDKTTSLEGVGVIVGKDKVLVPTGATLNAMPPSVRGPLYTEFEEKHGIRFLFRDELPEIDFYTVPWVDIAAVDAKGGFIASYNTGFDLREDVTLVYITKDRQCFLLTERSSELRSPPPRWREDLRPFDGVTFFDSLEDARRTLDIQTLEQLIGEEAYRQFLREP